ncbi:MAG: hypothetical protein ABI462_04200 [Ignavibacteria bacterium]
MKPSTELFDLIKSLTGTEKRYFRLSASIQKGDKNYIKLFDQIEGMRTYDETSLRKYYKRLTFTKNYLYNVIIKSLKAYSADNSQNVKLQEQLMKLKILYHKSLFRQFYKVLSLLKERSRQLENFTVYHELLKLEIQSVKTRDHKDIDLVKILTETKNVLTITGNLNEFNLASAIIRDTTRIHGMLRDQNSHKRISKVMDNPVIKKGITPDSTNKEKESYYKLMSAYGYMTGDMNALVDINEARLQIVENNPEIFEEDYVLKVIEISGALLHGYIMTEKFERFDHHFSKLKSLKAFSKLEMAMKFSKIYLYQFLNLLKQEKFKEGVELVKEAESTLTNYDSTIQKDDLIILRYYMCRIFFGAEDYKSALEYSNRLLNHPFIEYRADIQMYARILNLIIHYELQNYDLLPYIVKSVYRFLYKKKNFFRFEKIILGFLKSLKYSTSELELERRLILLRSDLIRLHDDPFEKNAFMYFELLSWFDRKRKSVKLETSNVRR